MNAEPECLILEDDPRRLDSLKATALRHGIHPLPARSASQAITMLRNRSEITPPILAIIDRDLRYALDQNATYQEVLRYLDKEYPDCLVLVYSANINDLAARNQVFAAHPRAHLQDKDDDDEALFTRIEKMLGKTVGDLRVVNMAVRHLNPACPICHPAGATPAGKDEYKHWVAVKLVMNYPEPVFLRTDTMGKAERRFRDWLKEHGSLVETVALDARKYRLRLRTPGAPSTPPSLGELYGSAEEDKLIIESFRQWAASQIDPNAPLNGGAKSLSPNQLAEEVANHTEFGHQQVSALRRSARQAGKDLAEALQVLQTAPEPL